MEFPDLGAHCHERTCNRLDFLPMKCDACSYIFCNNHVHYTKHECEKAYEKDMQVPVCPLCNNPVPTRRGQLPDLEVEQHILRDCLSDPAVNKRTVYSNKCSMKGCKQKELVPVTCSQCNKNYCLKHRHTSDHSCAGPASNSRSMSHAGAAALSRAQNSRNVQPANNHNSVSYSYNGPSPIGRIQDGMSDDEALAMAMRQSLMETGTSAAAPVQTCRVLQEKEDRLLAEALVASEKDTSKQVREGKEKSCVVS